MSPLSTTRPGNAFDALRLAAAWLVLFSHSFPFLNLTEPTFNGLSLGKIAVGIFFAMSGYLVTESLAADSNASRFLQRRALRLLPGLWVSLLVVVFLMGPFASQLSPGAYLTHADTWKYLASNLTLVAGVHELPGVFGDSTTPQVNGSLWTLRYEVLMYVLLVVLSRFRALRRAVTVTLVLCLALAADPADLGIARHGLPLPGLWKLGLEFNLGWLFLLGMSFYAGAWLRLAGPTAATVLVATAVCATLAVAAPQAYVARAALLLSAGLGSLFIALHLPGPWRGRWKNDLSYGIYIYAYPIQQLVTLQCQPLGVPWWGVIALSTAAVVPVAWLSWRFVERPALKLKPPRRSDQGPSDKISNPEPTATASYAEFHLPNS